MTQEQLSEAQAKLAEIDAMHAELGERIRINTETVRRMNEDNRQMIGQRNLLAGRKRELLAAIGNLPVMDKAEAGSDPA